MKLELNTDDHMAFRLTRDDGIVFSGYVQVEGTIRMGIDEEHVACHKDIW